MDPNFKTWFYRIPRGDYPLTLAPCQPGQVEEYSAGFGDNRRVGTAQEAFIYAVQTCRAAIGEDCHLYYQSASGHGRWVGLDDARLMANEMAAYLGSAHETEIIAR